MDDCPQATGYNEFDSIETKGNKESFVIFQDKVEDIICLTEHEAEWLAARLDFWLRRKWEDDIYNAQGKDEYGIYSDSNS